MSAQAPQAGGPPGAGYRPDDFLTLDLNRAVLSPRPLGPSARFEPYGVEAKSDVLPNTAGDASRLARAPRVEQRAQQAASAPQPADTQVDDEQQGPAWTANRSAGEPTMPEHRAPQRNTAERKPVERATAAGKPVEHRAAERRTVRRLAVRRHTNPLDAQAFDARPQVWPCRGNSGICAWR